MRCTRTLLCDFFSRKYTATLRRTRTHTHMVYMNKFLDELALRHDSRWREINEININEAYTQTCTQTYALNQNDGGIMTVKISSAQNYRTLFLNLGARAQKKTKQNQKQQRTNESEKFIDLKIKRKEIKTNRK